MSKSRIKFSAAYHHDEQADPDTEGRTAIEEGKLSVEENAGDHADQVYDGDCAGRHQYTQLKATRGTDNSGLVGQQKNQ